MATTRNATKKLQKDFELVARDARGLIEAVGEDADAKTKEALAKLKESLGSVKSKFETLENKTGAVVRTGGEIISEYPYQSVGVSLAFGVLLGMLFRRK